MDEPLSIPEWYRDFQAEVLRQLPDLSEIDKRTAEQWARHPVALKKFLLAHLSSKKRAAPYIKADKDRQFDESRAQSFPD